VQAGDKVKKILLSFVGTRDPSSQEDGSDGPVLTCVRELQPELVYLLGATLESNSRETLARLQSMNVGAQLVDTKIDDPTDYAEILGKMTEDIRRIDGKHAQVEYYINVSSGTPQMMACWLLLANSGRLNGRLIEVKSPRFVEQGSKRTFDVNIQFLREETEYDNALKLLESHQYDAVARIFRSLVDATNDPARRTFYYLFAQLSTCYLSWDSLFYSNAAGKCKKLVESFQQFQKSYATLPKLVKCLKIQQDTLSKLNEAQSSGQEAPQLFLDLYHNSRRRFEEGNYVDCLARFWRLYEGCLFYRLKEHGINPDKFHEQPDTKNRIRGTLGELPAYLSVDASWQLLTSFEDPFAVSISEMKGLDKLRALRNKTIVAHGFQSVKEENAKEALEYGKKLLKLLYELSDAQVEDYPFRKTVVVELFRDLQKVL
jgi:hypothetical protein